MTNAFQIALEFLLLGESESIPISHMKLQKLVFFAHGWHLGILEKPLVQDEMVEAWKYGPVFPSLYHEFKNNLTKPIEYNAAKDSITSSYLGLSFQPLSKESKNLIYRVWEVYKKFSAIQLSNITHEEGSPWHTIRVTRGGYARNTDIPNDLIIQYFQRKIKR